ncbi:MAG: class I SAM-dependent methyltransferase [Bacteroidales bacterium]|nr:class I SAM-dependent methyltransferase [Bacteroidales bacterium]
MEELFYEIFTELPRQGPGDHDSTIKALRAIPELPAAVRVLDVGCGTGNQTIDLAGEINGKIVAIDNYQPFLDRLEYNAAKHGLSDKIEIRLEDMFNLHFKEESFDIIWSEGAVYILGLEKALKQWKKFIKPQGYVVVSEFNWLVEEPPGEVYDYFMQESVHATDKEGSRNIISNAGYALITDFMIPKDDWYEFYNKLEEVLVLFRDIKADDRSALGVIGSFQYEIDLFRKYPGTYGYVFYIMQKRG